MRPLISATVAALFSLESGLHELNCDHQPDGHRRIIGRIEDYSITAATFLENSRKDSTCLSSYAIPRLNFMLGGSRLQEQISIQFKMEEKKVGLCLGIKTRLRAIDADVRSQLEASNVVNFDGDLLEDSKQRLSFSKVSPKTMDPGPFQCYLHPYYGNNTPNKYKLTLALDGSYMSLGPYLNGYALGSFVSWRIHWGSDTLIRTTYSAIL